MTVLLVLALWIAVACFAGLLFSAVVRAARPAAGGVENEAEHETATAPTARVDVPGPRASADERQPSSL